MSRQFTNDELWQLVLKENNLSWRWDSASPPPTRTFPIKPNHPMLVGPGTRWETLRFRLLAVLHQSRTDWSTLSLLHRRPTMQPIFDDDTTVVVVISDKVSPNAEIYLHDQLLHACRDEGLNTLNVELLRGQAILFADATDLEDSRRLTLGSSLGVSGVDWSAATCGGSITLQKAGVKMSCGLTCHHVLRPAPSSSSLIQLSIATSTPISSDSGEVIVVDHPALMDHLELLTCLSSLIRSVEDRMEPQTDGIDCSEYEPRKEALKKKYQALTDQKRTAEETNLRCGCVWASSGLSVAQDGFGLDWGVILVDKEREGLNLMPDAEDFVRKVRDLSKADLREILRVECINKIGSLSIDQTVVKIGRATGVTVGIVNSVRTDVQLPGSPHQTREFVVIGMRGRPFADEGDSGAFVILPDGALVGMVVGGDTKCNLTFVTPIQAIFNDIQTRTGWEVLLQGP